MAVLDRLLAACDLQLSATLEPYLADVDARVDELLATGKELDPAGVVNLVGTLEDDPDAVHHPIFRRPHREGPVAWAFDGTSALQLQGFRLPTQTLCFAVVLDTAARWWLRALRAPVQRNGTLIDVVEAPRHLVEESLQTPFWAAERFLLVRPVTELPAHVRLAVDWKDGPVPVATVDAVEQAHPTLAELLDSLRRRR